MKQQIAIIFGTFKYIGILVFYKNSPTEFYYQIKQKNSFGRIVYSADVKNGVIYNEYDSESLQIVNLNNGNFLYENYCYSCHNPKKESIGISVLKMKQIPINYFLKYFYSESAHKTIPKIKENELKSIHLYINSW